MSEAAPTTQISDGGTSGGESTGAQGQTEGQTQTQTTSQGGDTGEGTSADWRSGLNDELKGYVENKGFKDPHAVLDSYRHLEKLVGAPKERLVKLPEDIYDPEQMGEVYNRLGRPESPEKYELKFGEDDPEDFQKWTKGLFHKAGLNSKQAQSIMDGIESFSNDVKAKGAEETQARVAEEQKGLQREWGKAFDQNVKIARMAAKEFGVDEETLDKFVKTLGYSKTMQHFQKIGEQISEADFTSGDSAGFGPLTPNAAMAKIEALKRDNDFVKRYANGDVAARKEMDKLHEMAYVSQA